MSDYSDSDFSLTDDESFDDSIVLMKLEKMMEVNDPSIKKTIVPKPIKKTLKPEPPTNKIVPIKKVIDTVHSPSHTVHSTSQHQLLYTEQSMPPRPKTKIIQPPLTDGSKPPLCTDLTLATITMTSNIHTLINLEVVTRYLVLDNYVTGKSCDGIGSWGEATPKKKKSKKKDDCAKPNKNSNKIDFYNQLTVIVRPFGKDNDRKVNTKLFNNGQIVMTGIKDAIEAGLTVKSVIDSLNKDITGDVTYVPFTKIKEEFSVIDFEKFLKLHGQSLDYILGYAVEYIGVTYFPKLSGIFTINALLSDHYDLQKLDPELEAEIMLLLKFYQIFLIYLSFDEFKTLLIKISTGDGDTVENITKSLLKTSSTIVDYQHKFLEVVVDQALRNYNLVGKKISLKLPAYIKEGLITYEDKYTRIEMINSYFYTNFLIDRLNIQQLLINKYDIVADYKPDGYQGVNVKYISRVNCKLNVHKLCKCKNRKLCKCLCKCKEISIFIFRKGTIIVTGARAWSQIMDTYNFIKQVLLEEYPNIHLKKAAPPRRTKKETNLPDKVIADGHIWLNKKHICNNPKNFFLIKEFEISHLL